MGIGKSTITQELAMKTKNSAYLDGDWCWVIHPFIVNEENKKMVIKNIHFLLNSFIKNTMIETIFFCWVMDEQDIIDLVLTGIDKDKVDIVSISLTASRDKLKKNIQKDIDSGKRTPRDLKNSLERLPKFEQLDSIKVDITTKDISTVVHHLQEIIQAFY